MPGKQSKKHRQEYKAALREVALLSRNQLGMFHWEIVQDLKYTLEEIDREEAKRSERE